MNSASQPPCPFCTIDPSRIILANTHALAIHDAFPTQTPL
jgi:hypothetical protein